MLDQINIIYNNDMITIRKNNNKKFKQNLLLTRICFSGFESPAKRSDKW